MDLCLTVVDRTAGSLIKLQGCRENDSRQVSSHVATTFLAQRARAATNVFVAFFYRNGSKLSPTRSFVTWAATCAWTAAAPGWAASPWRSATPASTSSGSSPSIYNHRGRYRSPGGAWDYWWRHRQTPRPTERDEKDWRGKTNWVDL